MKLCLILLTIFCVTYTISYPSNSVAKDDLRKLFDDTRNSLQTLKDKELEIKSNFSNKITNVLLKLANQIEDMEAEENEIIENVQSGVAARDYSTHHDHIIINQRCHYNDKPCLKAKMYLSCCHHECNLDAYSTENYPETTTTEESNPFRSVYSTEIYPEVNFVEDFRVKFFKGMSESCNTDYSCNCDIKPSYLSSNGWSVAIRSGAILKLEYFL